MRGVRGKLDVESLLKIVLVLIAAVLAIQLLGWFVEVLAWLASMLIPILLAIVLVLIILYLLDRI